MDQRHFLAVRSLGQPPPLSNYFQFAHVRQTDEHLSG